MLPLSTVRVAFILALARAGNSMAARMAMIAITTSNSISVNPRVGDAPAFSFFILGPLPIVFNVARARSILQASTGPRPGGSESCPPECFLPLSPRAVIEALRKRIEFFCHAPGDVQGYNA